MNIVIIEDEILAANRLKKLLLEIDPSINVLSIIETVEDAIKWFNENLDIDLIIADIQLADGLSFEIFKNIKINSFIIFTTAYNNYAIDAFKHNSIDYLLKPLKKNELSNSLLKYKDIHSRITKANQLNVEDLLLQIKKDEIKYKTRFLVKTKQSLRTILVDYIMSFYIEGQLVFLQTYDKEKFLVEYTLNELEELLDPKKYFRINRQMIISISAIKTINQFFNQRLILDLEPSMPFDVIVSREKVIAFKKWLED